MVNFMAFTKLIVALAFLATGALVGQEPKVTQVLSKDLTDIPGKCPESVACLSS